MTSSSTLTELLIKWRNGDEAALNELLPQVYGQLRRLANYYLNKNGQITRCNPPPWFMRPT